MSFVIRRAPWKSDPPLSWMINPLRCRSYDRAAVEIVEALHTKATIKSAEDRQITVSGRIEQRSMKGRCGDQKSTQGNERHNANEKIHRRALIDERISLHKHARDHHENYEENNENPWQRSEERIPSGVAESWRIP